MDRQTTRKQNASGNFRGEGHKNKFKFMLFHETNVQPIAAVSFLFKI